MNDENEKKNDAQIKEENEREADEKNYKTTEEALQARLANQKLLIGQDLSSEARDVIDCFEKPRMILQRIFIIYNQTRQAMGKNLLKEMEIRQILEELEKKRYVIVEKFTYQNEQKEAFILTEKGKQLLE